MHELLDALSKSFTPVPASAHVEPEMSLAFDRVLQQAMVHAAVSSAKHVDTGSLLVFMLQEEESHAAYFLRRQGVDRLVAAPHDFARAEGRPGRRGGRR